MMINKRLIGTVKESKKYIAGNVFTQWISLLANITLMAAIANGLQKLYLGEMDRRWLLATIVLVCSMLAVRVGCTMISSRMSYFSAKEVKRTLRELIYRKLLRLGNSYTEHVQTSEVIQVAVEGVEQLETYFGAYLPQLFYAMLAPLTLFVVLGFVNLPAAIVLFVCVPMIPITIIVIQKWAKKLLGTYWGQYTSLGDTFLENLQGLTTTKIYQSDGYQHEKMNAQSEQFRKITMKVLTMQLNSITVMDLVAYGGAGVGMILAVNQLQRGRVDLVGAILIILLAADFFLPMRMLGSFFHMAMNGMAASDKIFRLLDLPEQEEKQGHFSEDMTIKASHVRFAYENDQEVLKDVSMEFPTGSFTAIVGESGCGKSTFASLLMGRKKGYEGEILVGTTPLSDICEKNLMEHFTYISHQSYLFQGTVRENLLMAKQNATDEELMCMLERVKLSGFLQAEDGLDTMLLENASNLSGGQRQRLALARALLHDSPVYIFDEATSNIDVESENDIMAEIFALAKRKTVILISHRLANVVRADRIYVMDHGVVSERGTHEELLEQHGVYERLWNAQQQLEQYTEGGNVS